MTVQDFASMSIAELAQKLEKKELCSVEVTQNLLKAISVQDERIGSFLKVDEKGALAAAKSSDERRNSGSSLGVLDGIPLGLKDLISTEGLETTAASKILQGYIPPFDATVTAKLKSAGAVIIGKTNLDEFAMGSSNENSAFKVCRNPWDLSRTPGGSSGGSAASVAARFCYGTLGTDTGGSIRLPASFCGITGLKPTYGRVSRYGVVAFASSLDQVGPMTRDVESNALMLQAIAGHDSRDSTSINAEVPDYQAALGKNIAGLRIGIPKEYFSDGIRADVRAAVERAISVLEAGGAVIKEVSLPHTKYAVATYYIVATAEASSNLSRYDGVRYGPRLGEEQGLNQMYQQTRGQLFGPEVQRRIMLGTYVLSAGYYDAFYLRAQKVRRLFAEDFTNAFKEVDAIIGPTSPTPAFKIGENIDDPLAMYLNDIFTIGANLAGLPAMSLPCGLSDDKMPIGVQLIGGALDESTLFTVAHAIEKELSIKEVPFNPLSLGEGGVRVD